MNSFVCRKLISIFICILLTLLILSMLFYPALCLNMALLGLNVWFQRMIPTLLPFMILTGVLVQSGLSEKAGAFLSPILGKLFHISNQCCYIIATGFLCGFPMGAYMISLLYQKRELSKKEAHFLLCFCNNLGPVFLLSYVMPQFTVTSTHPWMKADSLILTLLFLLLFYGIPLGYGWILRYTVYRTDFFKTLTSDRCFSHAQQNPMYLTPGNWFLLLENSISNSLSSITRLGGYMILFNLMAAVPVILHIPGNCNRFLHCLLEITGGIAQKDCSPILYLLLFPFGGISCMTQTFCVLQNTDLSKTWYLLHKLILTIISAVFFFCLASIFGLSFDPV